MRKRVIQQKDGIQLDLFRDKPVPFEEARGVTPTADSKGVELLSQLKEQKSLTQHLLEEVISYVNIRKAYERVLRNRGSGGVDDMGVAELGVWLQSNLENFTDEVLNERYAIQPVLKVVIPKPDGGERMLGIPTVKDRMLQQAIHQKLNPFYDQLFSESSFGFRHKRNAHQAILQASEYIKMGKEWVVDIDLEKFFDNVNHDRLMQRLSKGIGDKRLLRLIHGYLKAGIMTDGLTEQRIAGTPQGSPLSPLLSNIVLDELDKELERRGHSFCRYADDCNIFVSSRKAGERVMESMIKFIEQKLKLKVNRKKSGVRHCSNVTFLGYTLLEGGNIRISDKSIKRFKDKVRTITKRNRGVSIELIIREMNDLVRGWKNYFYLANRWLTTLRDLDSWIRRKIRCYRLKQLKRRYTIFKFLQNLGMPVSTSWNAIMYSQGWWALSNKMIVNKAMGLSWFKDLGLLSLH